jgi:molybdopterin converting factor subunit 1
MPIRVKLLYFGQAKEAAGTAEEDVSLPKASSVRTLIEHSARAHKKLESLSQVIRVAVNEEVAREDDRLADGDVVAFLPPVAGG